MEDCVMSGLEPTIIYTAGALLLSITASRFLLQELIALVVLYKKLKATIRTEVRSELPESSSQTDSKRELSSGSQ
jgi:hypothetical protein